jgi:hypothetical protein
MWLKGVLVPLYLSVSVKEKYAGGVIITHKGRAPYMLP